MVSTVSWTLLSILTNLNNTVVWMFSTRPLISKSSSHRTQPLVTPPTASIILGVTTHWCSIVLFNALSSFNIKQVLLFSFFLFFFFFFLLILTKSSHLTEIRWPICIKNHRELCASHFQGQIPGCAFVRIVKFKLLTLFLMDHLSDPLLSCLIRSLGKYTAFSYNVIDRFVSIST